MNRRYIAVIYKTLDEFEKMWNCYLKYLKETNLIDDIITTQKQINLLNGNRIRFGCRNKRDKCIFGRASFWTDVLVTPSVTKEDFDDQIYLRNLDYNTSHFKGFWVYKDVKKMQNLDQDLTYIINGNIEYY